MASLLSKKRYRNATPQFAQATRQARKVLAVDIGGLGDLVHALPALWSIRQTYPQAQLDVVARGHLAEFFRMVPWVDRVWPYFGRKKSVYGHDVRMARLVRAQAYDVSINLMGTNRSCVIGRVTGARHRLGRRPHESNREGWRWLNTHVMEYPQGGEQRYLQKWKCLAQAGICSEAPRFEFAPERAVSPLQGAVTDAPRPRYLHVSPCTSASQKELPPAQVAELLTALQQAFPGHRLVLSCAHNEREEAVLADILSRLPSAPWQVFAGTLDVSQLFAVVRDADLQLSGDTGPMHLAWLAGTPLVAWFSGESNLAEFGPCGRRHRVLVDPQRPQQHITGLATAELVAAARELLAVPAGVATAASCAA